MALTILLTILKVLGWILLGILGLIVLILLIVMLVPLRYRALIHATKDLNELTVGAHASWLLRLIKVTFDLEQKEIDAFLRIAWKKIPLTGEDEIEEKDQKKEKKVKKKEKASVETKEEKKTENVVVSEVKTETKDETENKTKPADLLADEEKQKKKEKKKDKKKKKEESSGTKEPKKKRRFTFDRICDTINEINFMKEDILAFLGEKSHRKIARRFIKRLKKLGHKLLPSRFVINGKLGFEDPYTTARLEAGLSTIYPRIEKIQLPELCYDQDIVDLDGDIKGKLRIGSLVAFALPLLLDINLWRTIKDFKSFKKKMDHSIEVIKEGEAA